MATKSVRHRITMLTLFVCTAASLNTSSFGQTRTLSVSVRMSEKEEYLVRAWTTKDGLPANYITEVLQTQDGYLWLATGGGLMRFNGFEFRVFSIEDLPGWKTGLIEKLYEGSDGALWFSSQTGELGRFQDNTFTSFFREDESPVGYILDWLELEGGTVWIATRTGAVRVQNGHVTTFTISDGLPSNAIVGLGQNQQGDLTVTTGVSLARLKGDRFVAYGPSFTPGDILAGTYLPEEDTWWLRPKGAGSVQILSGRGEVVPVPGELQGIRILFMQRDDQGMLWLITPIGMFSWKGSILTRYSAAQGLPSDLVGPIYEGRHEKFYLSAGPAEHSDFVQFAEGRFTTFDFRAYLDYDYVTGIHEDTEGNVWVGTNAGLLCLTPRKIKALTKQQGLSEDFVYPIYQTQDETIWIGTWGGGLNRIQDGQVTVFDTDDRLSSNFVRALHEDRAGHLWVGTAQGLSMLHDGTIINVFTAPWVQAIHEDSQNQLWFGGREGLYLLERGVSGVYKAAKVQSDLYEVNAIHEDSQGRLWVAAQNGLLSLDGTQWRTYTEQDGLSSPFVVSIYEAQDGILWFGTYGNGLNRLKDDRFFVYTTEDGLYSNGVWRILEDDHGNFWMSSDQGLFRVSKKELDDFAEGRVERITSVAYTESDGMPSAECNGRAQPTGWKMRDGRLWFATLHGVAIVDPDHLPVNTRPPPVHIEAVLVDGVPVDLTQAAHLPAGNRNVEFRYAALSLVAPEKNQYRFKLEGHDRDWVEAGTRRSVFYTRLPPGQYTFRVSAANNDGVWNETGASFAFHLKPFFHQTRWFYLLCAVFVVSLVGAGYHYRIKHLREKELKQQVEERTQSLQAEKRKTEAQAAQLQAQADRLKEMDRLKSRFFANLSHEFRTSLTMILGPVQDVLAGRYGAIGEAAQRALEPTARNALRVEQLIDQLLDLSKLEAGQMPLRRRPGELVGFLRGLVHAFTPLAERRRVAMQYHPEVEALPLAFDAEKLEKVLGNLIANALKFTPAQGKVLVTVADTGDGALMRVQDTGIGIPAEELPHVFDRFYQVDGSFTRSQEGTGVGLSLAKELVALHGGTIAVESVPGFGATFTVTLPRTAVSEGEAEEAGSAGEREAGLTAWLLEDSASQIEDREGRAWSEAEAAVPEPTRLSDRPTILIVEDHADVGAYLRAHFAASYQVGEARNGREALEQVRTHPPDLILCDVMLPEMDGLDLCRRLREDEALRSIPILLLTARADASDAVAGFAAGADDYVRKPFDMAELQARVSRLVASRRQLREQFSREIVMQPTGVVIKAEAEAFYESIRRIVERHLSHSHFSVEALAEEAGLTKSTLTRHLRAATGLTPGAFIRLLRLEHAARRLAQGAGNVSTVAHAVGYADVDHFTRIFYAHFGVAPSQYRAAHP